MSHKYKLVSKIKDVDRIIKYCKQTKICSFDFETTGSDFHNPDAYITIIGISFQHGSSYVIPLGHFESPFKSHWVEILKKLSDGIFMDPTIVKICQNAKFEHKWLYKYGCDIRGRLFDTMLAYYLLDEEANHGLDDQVKLFIPEYGEFKDETKILAQKHGWEFIPLKPLADRNALDADLTGRLMTFYEDRLIKAGLYTLFRNMCMMQHRVLAESEFTGFPVDRPYLDNLIVTQGKKIADNENQLLTHPTLLMYVRRRDKMLKKALIAEVESEIEKLYEEGKTDRDRVITNRQQKLGDYVNGIYKTKKDQELFGPFNFNSPKQLIDLLFTSKAGFRFKIVKYTTDKKTKKETDTPSTDEEVLLILKDKDKTDFIQSLLNHREMQKLYSTYMVGIRDVLSVDNKVHCNYKIQGTITGRLSSSQPNMQNIPRDVTSSLIKRMFLPPKGYLLVEGDYSQAELRIVAELAEEKVMIDSFNHNYNIHMATAVKSVKGSVNDEDYNYAKKAEKDENHPEHLFWVKKKKIAKTVNFGILYGQTAKKLSKTLSDATEEIVSIEEAQEFLDDWIKSFPAIAKWIKRQHNIAKRDGYVTNMFGRKRRLPNIYSDNFGKMLESQRQSVNAPIQGASSDFTQLSSILIREERLKGNLPDYLIQLATVHDSIEFPVKPEDVHWVIPKLQAIYEDPETQKWFGFKMEHVKMKASFEVGINWGNKKDYNPEEDYTKLLVI